jgi:outer membrane protein assembly factor BamB
MVIAYLGLALGFALVLAACGAPPTTSPVGAGTPSPAPAGPTVYLAAGSLYALHPSDGKQLWRYSAADNLATPAVAGGVIYTDDGHGVLALGVSDRGLRWRRELGHLVSSAPTVVDGMVYVGLGYPKDTTPFGAVCALRASDGALA